MKVANKKNFISFNGGLKNIEKINNQIADLYKEIKALNLKLNKKEDEIKDIITEKDNIIEEIENKLIMQENIIKNNKNEITKLNKIIEEIDNKYNYEINDKENNLIMPENLINNNKNRITNLNKRTEEINNKLITEINDKENKIIIQENIIKNNNNEIIKLNKRIEEIDNKFKSEINDKENKIIIQENIIKNNKNEIAKLNKRIEEIDNKFKSEINDKEKKINKNKEEMKNINNNLLKEIENKYKELNKISSDLNDKLSNNYKSEKYLYKNILSEKEKIESSENGFILFGLSGVGKTTLLNALFGKEVGKVGRSAVVITEESKAYNYTLKNRKNITIIDTPGIVCNDPYLDENKLHTENELKEFINKEKIKIKGLLFLVDFQKELFDSTEQEALLTLNQMFPFKAFWNYILIIFTHYFTMPYMTEEKKEEELRNRDKNNQEIFNKLMDRIKNVSDKIDYNQIKKKYFNCCWPIKNERMTKNNDKARNELEEELEKFTNMNPLL